MGRLGSESAFEVLRRAKALEAQGRHVVHLEIGEPDFTTAPHIVEAACRALRDGATHYVASAGIRELREAVAAHISPSRGHVIHPDQVVVTPGAKPIMFFVLLALAEPGREVIYPNPGFPIYESMINFCGAKPVALPLIEAKRFRFDTDQFRSLVNERTALVILNSPQNPTGGVLEREDLAAIAEVCAARDIPVLSDEIYEQIIYEGQFASIASQPGMSTAERTVLLHGFSKTYAMTGWRLGYGVMPLPLAEQVNRLMVNSNSCTAAATQWAGIAALQGPQDGVVEMVAAFRERRQVMVNGLNKLSGVRCVEPGGAFYAFPNIAGTGMDSATFAAWALDSCGVACLSGASFGCYGEGYVRFSYANSVDNIRLALQRLAEGLGTR
jgi:aspartate/methionine/tyrosine aminotransferase